MKNLRYVLTLVALLGVCIAFAHPATDVSTSFDKTKGILSVSFTHKVKDVAEHYIYDVKVMVNKKPVIEQKLSRQENVNGGTLIYRLPDVNAGDKIMVTTECSKGGKKSDSIDVK